MSRKIKPCYTLSDTTLKLLSSLVYWKFKDSWRIRFYFTGTERTEHYARIRKHISAYRQIEGYRDAKQHQSIHRSVMRKYPKKERKLISAALRRARKKSHSTPAT